jgi:ribosomal protein S18 acetylase RimI-like enzyme
MRPSDGRAIVRACIEDAEEILALQKLAYLSEAEIIGDYAIPPLRQTLDEIRAEFERQVFWKVESEGRIIGSVRGTLDGGTCYIGKLIVHPDDQNQGLGTALLRAAEGAFPMAERFELFTGERSAKNLHLYRKAGYRVFRSQVVSPTLTLVYLEKARRP